MKAYLYYQLFTSIFIIFTIPSLAICLRKCISVIVTFLAYLFCYHPTF
jgi:hypothetical protein